MRRPARPRRRRCLVEALVTEALLAAHRVPATLRLGVARRQGTLEAHAWLECGGRIVIGRVPDLDRFVPLPWDPFQDFTPAAELPS